tara:strand:+ start:416 stop:556 length:141 start_codon:yes stop_codon:yes gene_type:complete
MLSILSSLYLSLIGKLTSDFASVLMAVNIGYHISNAWIQTKGNDNA